MIISLIAAMTDDRVLGDKGSIPWHIPEDLKRFKDLTMGKSLIIGRKTHESIGRPLPGRRTIVMTRSVDPLLGVEVAFTKEQALRLVANEPEVFIGGGAEIYNQFYDIADRLYITLIHSPYSGDTFFPLFDRNEWNQKSFLVSKHEDTTFTFLDLERKK